MKKKLLRQEDYQKLLKMELPEIIKFLQESDYKKAIDELALSLKGVDLIEAALNKGLADFFRKLRQMSDMRTREILDIYLERWDIHNAKTVMRSFFSATPAEKMKHYLVPAGAMKEEFYLQLAKTNSIEEIIKRLSFANEKIREQMIAAYGSSKSLLQAESILDQYYYDKMFRSSKRLGADAAIFKRFLGDEIALLNLKTILRLRSENIDSAEIRKYLIMPQGHQDAEIMGVLNASSENLLSEVQKTRYGKHLSGSENSVDVEMAAEKFLVQKYASTAYMNPLSVTPLLTIMFIKAAEVSNLKRLIKAKQLGLPQDFIEKTVILQW